VRVTQLGMESRIPREPALSVTQSDLASFTTDRLGWFFGVYLSLKSREPVVTGAACLGTRLHAALERFYGYGHPLMESYQRVVDRELERLVLDRTWFDQDEWQREVELGRVMLEGYLEWLEETNADENLEVISAEEKLTAIIDVEGTPVELKGKVDCRMRDLSTGNALIMDWKTTAAFERLITVAPQAPQLLTYCTLSQLVYKDDPDNAAQDAMYTMFRRVGRGPRAKPPFYMRIEVHHSQTRLRNFYIQLYGMLRDYKNAVQALDEGVDFRMIAYPNPNPWSKYSPYRHIIELMNDGSRVEDLIADQFHQTDPHARYSEEPGLLSEIV
jgi:PD-(D/E)XK nuclease superfamily